MKPEKSLPEIWRRLAWIGWALVVLFWLPFEDLSPHGAVLIAGMALWLLASRGGSWGSVARIKQKVGLIGLCALQGCLAGLFTTPTALFLMILKSGLHAHAVPEFSTDQFMWVLIRTPIWIAVGTLIGLACGLISVAQAKDNHTAGV